MLEVFSDLSERLRYNLPDFPLYVRKGTLRQFDRYAAACHWHPDLEFILMLKGSMEYSVNGQLIHMDAGDGIFVNSKRLHYGFSSNQTDCSYIVVAVHPKLLGDDTHTGKVYLQDKFGPNTDDFVLLKHQTPWQREVLLLLSQMYDEMHKKVPNPLRLLAQAALLCANTGDHLQPDAGHLASDRSWMMISKMTGFIHLQYGFKITLDDIAAAGVVCRSRCCQLFGKYIGQTPNNYLNRYRILKGCEMLRETDRSISEVATACGFHSPGYFTYAFRKEMGLVPQDYRKHCKG